MRILGIDPGYERLGIAVLEAQNNARAKVVFSECFKTPAGLSFPERLEMVGAEIRRVIKKYRPEKLSVETLFLSNNQKTAMRVAEVRGVILYEGRQSGLAIFEATPPQIKAATTGSGRADKTQMIKMVGMLVEMDKKRTGVESDDEMDAIAIALTGLLHKI